MRAPALSLPLYIVDASAWSRYGTRIAVTEYIDEVVSRGLIMTCPPASLEYCFMARNKAEHDVFRSRMANFKQPDRHPAVSDVLAIQSALWGSGLVRAAGSLDTLIASYALLHNATIISCDRDYAHISTALDGALNYVHLHP
ncbi:PIN domain-containing protein [Paeniglutamicibacter sp.]|uniref:PIN domain-containing protein n=1 Tax=Paeniglutamicibacter sp. TaxID=1934391 RepID=UPI0039892625